MLKLLVFTFISESNEGLKLFHVFKLIKLFMILNVMFQILLVFSRRTLKEKLDSISCCLVAVTKFQDQKRVIEETV